MQTLILDFRPKILNPAIALRPRIYEVLFHGLGSCGFKNVLQVVGLASLKAISIQAAMYYHTYIYVYILELASESRSRIILLMEEILHHLWCPKYCNSKDLKGT